MFTKADCSKNLQIKNWISSCQRWSLHGFQTLNFICDRFGCKLWLLLIQNHAWHSFLAFALHSRKLMLCLIQIWADTLSLDMSSIQTCCFAQDSIENMQFCSYVIYLLRDEWMAKRFSEAMGAALVATTSCQFYRYFISHEKKKWLVAARNLQSIKAASRECQGLPPTWKHPVFVLACPTSASRAGELPQELGRWFCPLNLRLPSGTAFGKIARWPAGALLWTQTWTVPPDQRVVKVL